MMPLDNLLPSTAEKRLLNAELEAARNSAGLKKELSLGDLVLTQVLYITGLGWLGTAAKLGSAHSFFGFRQRCSSTFPPRLW